MLNQRVLLRRQGGRRQHRRRRRRRVGMGVEVVHQMVGYHGGGAAGVGVMRP